MRSSWVEAGHGYYLDSRVTLPENRIVHTSYREPVNATTDTVSCTHVMATVLVNLSMSRSYLDLSWELFTHIRGCATYDGETRYQMITHVVPTGTPTKKDCFVVSTGRLKYGRWRDLTIYSWLLHIVHTFWLHCYRSLSTHGAFRWILQGLSGP